MNSIQKPGKFNFVQAVVLGLTLGFCAFAVSGQAPTPQATPDKAAQAEAISAEAIAFFDTGTAESMQSAATKFRAAELLYQATGNSQGVGYCEVFLGRIEFSSGEMQKALDHYNLALPIMETIDDKSGMAVTLNNIGAVYRGFGDKQKALEFYARALPIYSAIADKDGEAMLHNNIGLVLDELGEKQKAIASYDRSLPLYRSTGNKNGEATALNNIGRLYSNQGEIQKALDYYGQALPLLKTAGNKGGEAVTLVNVGLAYASLGDQQKAAEYYLRALPLFKEVGDKNGVAAVLGNIGGIFNDLGERQKAFEYFNLALPLFRAVGNKEGEASTLNNIGLIYDDSDEKPKALEYYLQALPLYRSIGDKDGEATTLTNIGSFYSGSGDGRKALDHFNQSLSLYRIVGDRRGEALTLNNIGGVYDDLGEPRKALDYYCQSLPLHNAIGNISGEAGTLSNLMYLWAASGNRRLAVFYGKQAAGKYGLLRQNFRNFDKQTQQIYLKSVERTYRKVAELLIFSNRLAEAEQVLNSFKDQQFFDFDKSQERSVPLTLTPRETDLAATYQKAGERVAAAQKQANDLQRAFGDRPPDADETARLAKLNSDSDAALTEFAAVLKQAENELSGAISERDKVGPIADVEQMQAALRELSQSTGQTAVAVYQLVGQENFHALVISSDQIKSVSIPIKSSLINDEAKEFWDLLRSDKYDPTVASKQLYDVVFKPLEAMLPKDTATIMWSLDGNLRYVPMAALWDGKRFLAERYNHVVFTRADKDRMTRAVSRVWTGTGFGSSRAATAVVLGEKIPFAALPGVTDELAAIFRGPGGGVIDGSVLPDKQFDRAGFLAALKQHRPLVHIASHFSFRPGDEARSFLLLGDGSAFTLEEMKKEANLFQGVELLTLSACNTAAQQTGANGREIDGFAELAQRLGAGAVMATLWPVSDASTPWLMRDFYAARQAVGGTNKAEALRKAQLALINGKADAKPLADGRRSDPIDLDGSAARAPLYVKDPAKPFAHPYYWAPFVLIGNWR